MLEKTVALATLLLSAQVQAQMNQGAANTGPADGVTSGPAAGPPTSMRSSQAGPSKDDQSVRGKNDETGAAGSSSPLYAPPR